MTTLTEPMTGKRRRPAAHPTRPRRRDVVDNDENAAFTHRIIRAPARRAGAGHARHRDEPKAVTPACRR